MAGVRMPARLKNMTAFVDGVGMAGLVSELTPPKLVEKTSDYQGGGMPGPVKVGMGLEAMDAELTLAEHTVEVLTLFAKDDVGLTLRGAGENDERTDTIIINLRGRFYESDPGAWKPGEDNEVKQTFNCTYYKATINGEVIHEVDFKNNLRVIGGVDQLAGVREALGM